MRIAVTVFVIIGVLASIGLGVKWNSDYNSYKQELTSASDTATELGVDISSEILTIAPLSFNDLP